LSAFIALSLSIYVILLVLATYLTKTILPSALPFLLAFSAVLSAVFVRKQTGHEARQARQARKKQETSTVVVSVPAPRRWRILRLTPMLSLLAFLPGILALGLSTRMQISVHGFFHSAYVYQILHGMIPPENVTLPGYPVNNYWPYHAILAVFSRILQAPPPLASAWLNILSLLVSLALSYRLIRLLIREVSLLQGVTLAFVGLFGMNLFGAFHTWIDGDQDPLRPGVLMGDYRVAHMFDKFLNFSGFSVGIMLYLFVLVILAGVVINKRFSRYDFLSLAMSGFGALLIHATTGLFMALVLPVALAVIYLVYLWRTHRGHLLQAILSDARSLSRPLRSPGNLVSLGVIGAVAVIVLHSVYRTSIAMPVKSEIDWFSLYDTQSILGVIYPLLPFLLIGMVWAWKKDLYPVLLLGFIYVMGCGLALVTALPDGNDYKFIVLATIPACFAAASTLKELSHRKLFNALMYLVIALTVVNLLMLGAFRLSMDWFSDRTFRYQGSHATAIVQKNEEYPDLRYADLFLWARDATPENTVIIVPREHKDRSALFLLSERVPYYVDGDIFNRLPARRTRVNQIEALYKSSVKAAEKLEILHSIREELPDRPFLFIYPHDIAPFPELKELEPKEGIHAGELADGYFFPALEPGITLK